MFFFFECSSDPRYLPVLTHSFPTRRSSELVALSHTLQSVALQSLVKFLRPPVKFAAPLFEPFAGCGWQTESRHDRLRLGFAEQVAVEPAVSCRSPHPDIPGTQLVAQMSDRRDFPETPVDLAVIAHDDFPPFLAAGHRSVARQIEFRPDEHTSELTSIMRN